jgi:hypothetical protein
VAHDSDERLLALHAVRIKGFADDRTVADRFGLDRAKVTEHLLDFEAYGWVRRSEFLDLSGFGITSRGKTENETQLRTELEAAGAAPAVRASYERFLADNERLLRACTRWQLRPRAGDPYAANDHSDWGWDERVLRDLRDLHGRLGEVVPELSGLLTRFGGYDARFGAALRRVDEGDPSWVDRPREDSCHTVWMELHEDLLATLGVERGGPDTDP